MRILLISPVKSSQLSRKTPGSIRFPMVSLLYLAGLTPPEHQVSLLEEETEELDFGADCDLVGISTMTATASRAYAIADEFRRRGKIVVMGGVHTSVLPDEARPHCDAVVVGEAEPVWGPILADAQRGTLKPVYRAGTDWSLDDYPLPRRVPGHSSVVLGVVPVVTSRGCPYACEFCCVRSVFGQKIRHVDVARVVQDIQASGSRRVMFLDDNIVGDQAYATRLFEAIRPLGLQWVGQASISFVRNRELLQLAARSGCKGLFIGFESVGKTKIERMKKSMKTLSDTEEAVRRLHDFGIHIHASLVFGFDSDDPSIFDQTLEFLHRTRMSSVTFNILTPYPGTDLYAQLDAEGRLLTRNWDFFDHCTPNFLPRNMSVEELYEGYFRVKKSFLSMASVAYRFPANVKAPLLYLLANIGMKMDLRQERSLIDRRTAAMRQASPEGASLAIPSP